MVLGDGAGLGKTLQTIAAYAFCLQKDPTLKLLIASPKSAMGQWAEEFEKFTSGIKVHVLQNRYGQIKGSNRVAPVPLLKKHGLKHKVHRGFNARRLQYMSVKAHVFVVSYYAIQEDYRFLIANRNPNFIVVYDECQEFKNRKTKTWFGASEIAKASCRVYGLSATIIKNKLEEAYNIYRVIVPGLFGSVARFNKEFLKLKKNRIKRGGKIIRFNKVIGYKNLDLFRETIDPYFLIRRTRDVANELPSLISKKIVLEMSDKQRMLYRDALNGTIYRERVKVQYYEYRELVENAPEVTDEMADKLEKLYERYEMSLTEDGMAASKVTALSYCQLVSNGPQWLDPDESGESSKETEFRRVCDQELRCEKTIVFTRFKSGISRLEAILDELEIDHRKITGDVTGEDRDKARLEFQDTKKDIPIIFITQAGSAALNLQSANVLLFYDTPWSYGDLYQTIGRAQRIGSVHPHLHVIHFCNRKTIDEHVLKILEDKKDLITDVMGDIAEGAIEFGKTDVAFKDDESSVDALFSSVFRKVA
jgi:SNF2 family DNA or RNA helicase